MKLRYAMIAEYANVTGDGKLNLMGVTDRLFAYQFPAVHRDLIVVNSIETENDDENTQQQLQVQLIDPDGRTVAELKGQLDIGSGKQVFHQIHVFQDVQFKTPGAYQVNLFFNEKEVQNIPLELVHLPPPAQP
jgi:hypothetical protein